jgi:hypothetical protein
MAVAIEHRIEAEVRDKAFEAAIADHRIEAGAAAYLRALGVPWPGPMR